jgi:ABC-type multidrug transport system fused ATPase/permease subunit
MLGTLLAALISGETLSALQRVRQTVLAYVVAAAFGFAAAVFLLLALYIWLARLWGPITAALVFGLFFLAVAMLVILTARMRARARAKRAAQRRQSELVTVGLVSAVSGAPSVFKGRRGRYGAAAALVPLAAMGLYAAYRLVRGGGRDNTG